MNPSSTCYTIIHDDLVDTPTSQDLRNALQKGSDEVKLETMRRIIVGTLNGQSHVSRQACEPPRAGNGWSSRVAVVAHADYSIRPAVAE